MPRKLLSILLLLTPLWLGSIALAISAVAGTTAESSGTEKSDDARHALFFITNRSQRARNTKFGDARSENLVYGEYVNAAQIESTKNASKVIFNSEAAFLEAVKAATGKKRLTVFVHGYRKSFEGSMDFGLQMAKHLDAPLVVFAWPSKNNYCAYMTDECTAEWSANHFASVLADLGGSIGYHNIALVSHSLGARIVAWALKDLYAENRPNEKFAASLFFSPDVDRDTFWQDAKFLKQACADCRVYLDKHDTRIWISKQLHGNPRVGSPGKNGAPDSEISKMFRYDNSLPSHHIPFELVAATVQQIAVAPSSSAGTANSLVLTGADALPGAGEKFSN